ncbi:hypothetical protein NDU88_004617 [Pleurodeles waltl]|uniref:Uncharacterized protein n=1 Tax=Pleurodeles waltl TaxID=8319 RepID=A0AAV7MXQ9_PLEWA|nr:hypothetical protein NDU88_004617 [Pleurodeles waltl]
MGPHRQTDVLQGNTMEQYTTVGPLPQRAARLGGTEEGQSGMLPAEELSQAEILAAIQGSRVALEGKIETVVVEVNLLRADLRKVMDKVKVAGGSIVELQMEVGALRKAVLENGKISIYPDYANKVKNSQKSFLEVKAKLRAMNVRYMLLYPVRLKALSGGRSHFFEQPEEVWRWLEMWDKVTPSRLTGTGGVAHRASRGDGPDWWICEGDLSKDTVARGLDVDPALRLEIQDWTMAAIPAGSVDGSGGRPELDSLLASVQD